MDPEVELAEDNPPPARRGLIGFLRRAWPWLVGIAILAVIVARVPVASFRDAMTHGPHHWLAAVNLAIIAVFLVTDGVATWIGLIAVRLRRPLFDVVVVRGAIYLLFLVNYALGQGGFGYYLHRTGAPIKQAVGATLFLMGTNLAVLLLLTSGAWAVVGGGVPAALWWTLTVGSAGFAAYLVVVALSPGFLVRRDWLAPLFDAGVRGHAIAMVGRVPHVFFLAFSQWLAMRVWGIDVPLSAALTIAPAIAIAAALPISPGGLGTTQAAFVYLFSDYAAGATVDERQAVVLAFSIVQFVYGALASAVVGLACIPLARRTGALPRPATS